MKMYEISFKLEAKKGYKILDRYIEDLLPKKGNGLVNIFSIGSTSSVIIIEYDKNLLEDLDDLLNTLLPFDEEYKHHKTWGDDNGASHLRATFLGQSITLPWKNGKIVKGTWQNIVLINHDTRDRERKVMVSIIEL